MVQSLSSATTDASYPTGKPSDSGIHKNSVDMNSTEARAETMVAHDHNGSMTSLGDLGFRPSAEVSVRMVPVTSGYCLAGGPTGKAPTAWYSDSGGLTTSPCG